MAKEFRFCCLLAIVHIWQAVCSDTLSGIDAWKRSYRAPIRDVASLLGCGPIISNLYNRCAKLEDVRPCEIGTGCDGTNKTLYLIIPESEENRESHSGTMRTVSLTRTQTDSEPTSPQYTYHRSGKVNSFSMRKQVRAQQRYWGKHINSSRSRIFSPCFIFPASSTIPPQ